MISPLLICICLLVLLNIFSLSLKTDLCGIRWRKFVFVDPVSEPLKDPILRSYARCLREDILCVWRRISSKKVDTFNPNNLYDTRPQNSVTFPPLSLKTSKELWIFWYKEEPDLNELLVPELMKPTVEITEGSYESGISYEIRSLLFKALHNLIERYVRQYSGFCFQFHYDFMLIYSFLDVYYRGV